MPLPGPHGKSSWFSRADVEVVHARIVTLALPGMTDALLLVGIIIIG